MVVPAVARRETVLRDLEQEARDAQRGLWVDPKPVAPWDWRKNAAAARKLQGTRRCGVVFPRWICSMDEERGEAITRIQALLRGHPRGPAALEGQMQERREEAEKENRE